jgi:hypothetical protein
MTPFDHEHDPHHARSFVRMLLVAGVVGVVIIGALNAYIDPTGVTGRVTPWRVAKNSEARTAKVDLYDRLDAPPEIVLLGSSRTMKFDPTTVEKITNRRAFNAAVSGATPQDALLFTSLLADKQADDFPHIVWGLDVDQLRRKQLREGLSTDARMLQYLPLGQRFATRLTAAGELVTWQTTKLSLKALRAGKQPQVSKDQALAAFRGDGFQLWTRKLPRTPEALRRAVTKQLDNYESLVFGRDSFDQIERAPLTDVRRTIEIANEHGDEPTIFLTPYHPDAATRLKTHEIDRLTREARESVRQLRDEGLRFRLVDLTNISTFGGDPAGFYDGVHMTPENADRVLRYLDSKDGLNPSSAP